MIILLLLLIGSVVIVHKIVIAVLHATIVDSVFVSVAIVVSINKVVVICD